MSIGVLIGSKIALFFLARLLHCRVMASEACVFCAFRF